MQLTEKKDGRLNVQGSAMIDAVVYMMTERAEAAFGPNIIDELDKSISMTQCDYPHKKALEYLASEFFAIYLLPMLKQSSPNSRSTQTLSGLPRLTEKTYVDYFVLLTKLDTDRIGFKKLYRATSGVQAILTGFQTLSAYPLCEGIVTFFKETNDPQGLVDLISGLCARIKQESMKDDD